MNALNEYISTMVTATAWLYAKNALEVQDVYERMLSA